MSITGPAAILNKIKAAGSQSQGSPPKVAAAMATTAPRPEVKVGDWVYMPRRPTTISLARDESKDEGDFSIGGGRGNGALRVMMRNDWLVGLVGAFCNDDGSQISLKPQSELGYIVFERFASSDNSDIIAAPTEKDGQLAAASLGTINLTVLDPHLVQTTIDLLMQSKHDPVLTVFNEVQGSIRTLLAQGEVLRAQNVAYEYSKLMEEIGEPLKEFAVKLKMFGPT